ncbi:MAG: hypothetical protein MUC81_12405 [Bacteroidia bacterium]|nr:hypothetical protein [Bacteroidia bacterium]
MRLIKISITVFTVVLCFFMLYVIYHNSKQHEWFSLSIMFYYAIGLSILYLIVLITIGLIVKGFKNNQAGNSIVKSARFSFILLLITLIMNFVISTTGFNQWKYEADQAGHTNSELKKKVVQKRLDSLDQEILNSPNNYLALIQRGLLKRQNGKVEESISDYESA